jgi:acetylornithine deacetylase/succinyl-diaminopimelate desuccinylase-like protein
MGELEAIFEYIDKHRGEFIEDLRMLLRQPTIAATKEGIKETAEMTASFLKEAGVKTDSAQIDDGSPVIYGELEAKDTKKTLLLYSMYDVMPVNPELWASPPWEAKIVEEKIVARGAVNTKGPLMAQIEAVKAIMKVAERPPAGLIFLVEGEEELGSPSLPAFVKSQEESLKRADALAMLVGVTEGEEVFDILLGMKGIIVLNLELKLREMDVHGCYSPILDNPAWRLCWALSSMKDVRDEILIEGFYDEVLPIRLDDLKLIEEGAKTMDEEKIKALCGTERLRKDMHGVGLLKELLFAPTLNIDGIKSGYTGAGYKTINPGNAWVQVDIRLVPNMSENDVLDKVKRHLRKHGFEDVRVTKVASYGWAKTSAKEHIVQSAIKAAGEMGLKHRVTPFNPGSAPFYLFAGPPLISICSPSASELYT